MPGQISRQRHLPIAVADIWQRHSTRTSHTLISIAFWPHNKNRQMSEKWQEMQMKQKNIASVQLLCCLTFGSLNSHYISKPLNNIKYSKTFDLSLVSQKRYYVSSLQIRQVQGELFHRPVILFFFICFENILVSVFKLRPRA